MEEAGKELILYAVGNSAPAPLKKQYIGFGGTTILSILDHLHQKTAIRMTTVQKYEYKNAGFNAPWDLTTSITAYFTSLKCFQISLGNRGIATSDAKKTMATGTQMWNSEMFTEDQMLSWENKPAINQTWPNLQTYFTKKWLEWKQYLAMMAKQSHFKEAALLPGKQLPWKRKVRPKQCSSQCCKNSTTSKCQQWQLPTRPTWTP